MPKQPTKNENKEDKPFYKNQSIVRTSQGKGTVLRSFKKNGEWMYMVMLDDDYSQILELPLNRVHPLAFEPLRNPYVLDL